MTTSPPTQDALEPCPFCGEAPRTYRRMDESLFSHDQVEYLTITCTECDRANGSSEQHDKLITAWNRRALATPINGEDREVLARVIDPEAWSRFDALLAAGQGSYPDKTYLVRPSLTKADTCLRALAGRGGGEP